MKPLLWLGKPKRQRKLADLQLFNDLLGSLTLASLEGHHRHRLLVAAKGRRSRSITKKKEKRKKKRNRKENRMKKKKKMKRVRKGRPRPHDSPGRFGSSGPRKPLQCLPSFTAESEK